MDRQIMPSTPSTPSIIITKSDIKSLVRLLHLPPIVTLSPSSSPSSPATSPPTSPAASITKSHIACLAPLPPYLRSSFYITGGGGGGGGGGPFHHAPARKMELCLFHCEVNEEVLVQIFGEVVGIVKAAGAKSHKEEIGHVDNGTMVQFKQRMVKIWEYIQYCLHVDAEEVGEEEDKGGGRETKLYFPRSCVGCIVRDIVSDLSTVKVLMAGIIGIAGDSRKGAVESVLVESWMRLEGKKEERKLMKKGMGREERRKGVSKAMERLRTQVECLKRYGRSLHEREKEATRGDEDVEMVDG